jgi:hypothetical protein
MRIIFMNAEGFLPRSGVTLIVLIGGAAYPLDALKAEGMASRAGYCFKKSCR